jgi:5,5'-dehydrodivanillate O-demethylase
VKVAGYPVKELAGLIFAYLGPQPAPLLPRWEQLIWDDAVRDIAISHLPCNWLQCQENSVDPVHVEWMHAYFAKYIQEGPGFNGPDQLMNLPKHQKIGFDAFEHGIIKRRVLEGYSEEDDDWKEGHPILFPNILLVGSGASCTFQFRVPIDDENTYHVSLYAWRPAPGAVAPMQEVVPYREVALKDDDGRWVVNLVFNQDYMGWVTQGPIARRDLEKLGESDKGLIMLRKMLREQIGVMEDGGDPMNVFRNEPDETGIHAPMEQVKFGMKRMLKYLPGESGYSEDAEMINEVLQTWAP